MKVNNQVFVPAYRQYPENSKQQKTAYCAFLDISRAFDKVSHESVNVALEERVVRTIVRSIWDMLSTSTAEIATGNKTLTIKTTLYTSQRTVTFFLIVNELLNRLTESRINRIKYADDIVIVARRKFEKTLCEII